jgi:leucyl aminopeptidase
MLTVHQTPLIALTITPSRDIETDLLILPVFEGDALTDETGLDSASGGELAAALARREVTGKTYDLFFTGVRGWKSPRVLLVGAGPRAEFTADRLRRAAVAGGLVARDRGVTRIALVHRAGTGVTPEQAAQVLAEGAVLSSFDGASYKTGDTRRVWLTAVQVRVDGQSPAIEAALERGRVLGECTNLARSLSNEPSNTLTPRVFAERAETLAKDAGLSAEILDEKRIADLKMGLLLGVARGSAEPPRVLVMRHSPSGAPARPILGLVGKGITFDTGGISIKPADGMERMKDDMAGGAAVVGAMRALSLLKAPINVIGVVPMTENMPGGRAVKPGDILTAASGTTVEVLNTDAEGRLILGDGLWYAQKLGATHLVDVATLTGACVVALGKAASGLFGQPDAFVDVVRRTANRAGDRCWPLPLYEEYREQIKSEIADMVNVGGRPASVCTAAMFIKEFVGDLPWAHLDIAGTAWADEAKPWMAKGATGVAVRTLAELAFNSAEWQ